ncbi:hypothetical protein UVI_02008330 [Ustilaginoidea virens]|uniref:Uncharacterized protein n=1 Tax=Ustilaginoidea virens TaxID=1159556 RepID=A0A1B5L9E8_USTVR|nr:hypothetical protein UVI_02008330 [Ustilaginoidea virens]
MPAAVEHDGNGSTPGFKRASAAYSYAQRSLDRAIPPSSRQNAYDHISAFAAARPVLFSLLVAQALLSGFPVLLFASFSVSCLVFALGAAILFALFWTGVALLVLVPTLLVTASIGLLVWAWCVGGFVVARWLYHHAPFGADADVQVKAGGKQVNFVKDENGLDGSVVDKQTAE